MPRYVVEREFAAGLQVPIDDTGARACAAVVESNLADQVTWVHSYVSADKKKTFCIYDAPSPEAIRLAAGHPLARTAQVEVRPYWDAPWDH